MSRKETLDILVGETLTSDIANVYLSLADTKILSRLYPFGYDADAIVPTEYEMDSIELASRLYLRRGGEGEIQHSENGVARIYKSVDDEDILSRLVPIAKVI